MRDLTHGDAPQTAALSVIAAALTLAAVAAAPAAAAPTAATAGIGAIQGFVWDDLNRNGIQDQGEPGAANVSIGYQQVVDGRPGLLAMQAETGPDGAYTITGVPAGLYSVLASTDYWLFTEAGAGQDRTKDNDFADYTGNPGRGVQQWAAADGITVGDGATVTLDAGVKKRPGGSGTIRGRAWDDLDHNGLQNPGEPGVAGVEIGYQHIVDGVAAGNTLGNVRTAADGTYVLEGLPVGEYQVFATTMDRDFTVAHAGNRPRKDSDFRGGGNLGSARQARTEVVTVARNKTLVLDAGLIEQS